MQTTSKQVRAHGAEVRLQRPETTQRRVKRAPITGRKCRSATTPSLLAELSARAAAATCGNKRAVQKTSRYHLARLPRGTQRSNKPFTPPTRRSVVRSHAHYSP